MVNSQQEYAPEVDPPIVEIITSKVADSTAKGFEITCSEVMQKSANELFESAQNSMQNNVQNNAKTTQNAHLQNADNERVAMCSLEE
nr:hypothetical protein [uncultured Bacteroides sp.]